MTSANSRKISNLGFVCALLVVAIHVRYVLPDAGAAYLAVHYVIRHLFGSIAVPFFFIVSGYFLVGHIGEEGWWRKALTRRLRTLGLPMLIWCLIPFLLFSVFWTAGEAGGICARVALKPSSIAAAFGLNFFTNPEANRPLWYLRMLLMLVAISPALVWLVRKSRGWILPFLCAACWAVNPGDFEVPNFWLSMRWQIFWVFGFSVEGVFYFCVGLFLGLHQVELSRRVGLIAGAIALVIGIFGLYLKLRGLVGWSYCVVVSIPFMLAFAWTLIPSAEWNRHLIGTTFAIYVMHPVLIRTFAMLGVIPAGPFGALIEWAAVVVASFALAVVFRRIAPKVAAIAFGGR